MSAITKEQVVSFIENMSVLELSQLVKDLEAKFGVSAAAPVGGVVVAAAGGGAAAAEEVEEKTAFDLVLDDVPADKKIAVLKIVREITGLGLKDAKDLVESTPKTIKEGLPKADAEAAKKQIEEAGGKVSIK